MKIVVDLSEKSVTLTASRKIYSADAVRIAAHIFESRAEVYHRASKAKPEHELTLVSRRPDLDESALAALGGEFLNELLNQEYRFVIARFNRKIADVIAAQTLISARGGADPASAAPDSPELLEQTRQLMAQAEAEIRQTMPKKLPPQGPLYPPEVHAR